MGWVEKGNTADASREWNLSRNCSAAVYPLISCVVLLVCIILAWPFARTSFDDDWSYTYVALKFAQTGHLHYSGWGGAMILFQIFWGAIWIRLCGFSFDIVRISTIPFSCAVVLLVYALSRQAGLACHRAFFAALVMGTSPLFLPFAASFMTEVYACFFILACLYAAIAAAQAPSGGHADVRWLWVLAVCGTIGGADRQVVWAAPLTLIPYLWMRRSNQRFRWHAGLSYVVLIVSVVLLTRTLSQPYAPLELSKRQMVSLAFQKGLYATSMISDSALSCLLVGLPALLCLMPRWKDLGAVRLIQCGVTATVATAFLLIVVGGRYGLAPFLGNIMSPVGILNPEEDALGIRPVILHTSVRLLLTWSLLFSVTALIRLGATQRVSVGSIPVRVFAIFSFGYTLLLFPGSLLGITYDRYLLPLLPLLVICILLAFGSRAQPVPVLAWACVILFGAYATATTHDYFSGVRARVLAAEDLRNRGVPRYRISGGFDYDGWTQLEVAGTITPPIYGEKLFVTPYNFWFWNKSTALKPDYVVCFWPEPNPPPEKIAAVSFRTWLPPFRRTVVALKRTDLMRIPSHLFAEGIKDGAGSEEAGLRLAFSARP
jgi:hypothetical protein